MAKASSAALKPKVTESGDERMEDGARLMEPDCGAENAYGRMLRARRRVSVPRAVSPGALRPSMVLVGDLDKLRDIRRLRRDRAINIGEEL
jgi:hypothetical protein